MVLCSNSQTETEALGEMLAEHLKEGAIVAFFGDLGAGKTAFIRGMARGLRIQEPITSPTFTIVNEYDGRLPLFHFDLYRLSGEDELFEIGFEDYVSRGGICAVEWSERAADCFKSDCICVEMKRGEGDHQRIITIEGGGLDDEYFSH